MRLSFIVPVYNEEGTVGEVLRALDALELDQQIYYGRSYAEGKKISWRDGARAVLVILGVRLGLY